MDDNYARCLSDAEILDRLAKNLRDNFHWLERKYKDSIFKVTYNMLLHNPQDANDVTQEVFIKTWLKLRKMEEKGIDIRQTFRVLKEGQDTRLRPWLFRIVRNECLNHRRDKGRLKRSPSVPPITDKDLIEDVEYNQGLSAEDEAIQRENDAELYYMLGCLSERQREIIILHYVGELSDREIARVLKRKRDIILKPGTIKKARQRILKRLQDMIANKKSGEQMAGAAYDEHSLSSNKENTWNKKMTI